MSQSRTKHSHMKFGIQPLMGRCLYGALKMFCLHNNTYSITLAEMNITSRFQIISVAMGIKAFCTLQEETAKCLHKMLLSLHKNHKHFARLGRFRR